MSGVIKDGMKDVLLDNMFGSSYMILHNQPSLDASTTLTSISSGGGYNGRAFVFDSASGGNKTAPVQQWTASDGSFPTVSGWGVMSFTIFGFPQLMGEVDPANPVSVAENETYEVDMSVVS